MGDPAGIGPEICLHLLANPSIGETCVPVIFGDAAVLAEARRRWPVIGRMALLHRTGLVERGEAAVVAAVSTPHRAEACAAAHFASDELKRTVEHIDARSRFFELFDVYEAFVSTHREVIQSIVRWVWSGAPCRR